ncbi:asialoglycoprotein receptor 1-like isoform X2 [Stegastes partitus]|uniref:Asialoglycoprotein receptor 1-like isoform X2 n=1 Tax=Stegastes partitus TaxID=144197 RepID=A0A9Y4TMN5_9TELE|nr:PREDICTED: asialoglycoprotein receptor 1-like isoform X2 [Stegastes partitus]
MAEGEVSYASVVFKTNAQPRQGAPKEEETVYDEVKVGNQTTEQHADANGFLQDKKAHGRLRRYQQLACGLGTVCLILLLGVIAGCIYISRLNNVSDVSQLNHIRDNQTALMAVNRNLTESNDKLSSDNEKLRKDHSSLTVQLDNLKQDYAVLENNITNLTEANWNLTMQNQELEKDKKNLTEQIQNMETSWNELNTSRAQWTIDAYCPENKGNRQCKPCQDGWEMSESNCYVIHNTDNYDELKTWEEAQENCRGKNSDLAVAATEAQKNVVTGYSWPGNYNQYWIGLRAEDNKWKWVDGTDLTESSWIQQPPPEGFCAVSVNNAGWRAVSCDMKNRWICQKKALSV